jgi:hypothetical protein
VPTNQAKGDADAAALAPAHLTRTRLHDLHDVTGAQAVAERHLMPPNR